MRPRPASRVRSMEGVLWGLSLSFRRPLRPLGRRWQIQLDFGYYSLATGDPQSLASSARGEVRAVDAALPVSQVRTMDQVIGITEARPRFLTLMLTPLPSTQNSLFVLAYIRSSAPKLRSTIQSYTCHSRKQPEIETSVVCPMGMIERCVT